MVVLLYLYLLLNHKNQEITMSNLTVNQFLAKFKAGDFNSPDVKTQIAAGWYDWFCKDKNLLAKTRKLGKILARIMKNGTDKFDGDKVFVCFKNNCPLYGKLYDDIRIGNEAQGNLFVIVPSNGHSESGEAQVFDLSAGFEFPVAEGSMSDVYAFFKKAS